MALQGMADFAKHRRSLKSTRKTDKIVSALYIIMTLHVKPFDLEITLGWTGIKAIKPHGYPI